MRQSSRKELRIQRGIALSKDGGSNRTLLEFQRTLATGQAVLEALFAKVQADQISVTDSNDLYKLANSLSGLAKAYVEISRWEAEKIGLLDEAMENLCAEVQILLSQDPELLERILIIIEQAHGRTLPQLPAHSL